MRTTRHGPEYSQTGMPMLTFGVLFVPGFLYGSVANGAPHKRAT